MKSKSLAFLVGFNCFLMILADSTNPTLIETNLLNSTIDNHSSNLNSSSQDANSQSLSPQPSVNNLIYSSKPYSNIPYTNNSHLVNASLPSSSQNIRSLSLMQNDRSFPSPITPSFYQNPHSSGTFLQRGNHQINAPLSSMQNLHYKELNPASNRNPNINFVPNKYVDQINANVSPSSNYNPEFEYKCQHSKQPELPRLSPKQKANSLVAQIHKSGYHGYVLFTNVESINGKYDQIVVYVNVKHIHTTGQPIKGAFSWKVYNQHSIDSNGRCPLFLTSDEVLHDLTVNFGPIITDKPSSFTSDEFTQAIQNPSSSNENYEHKKGLSSLLGKTLMLVGVESSIKICTTILTTAEKQLYEAKLHYPIAGRVKVLQGLNQNSMAVMSEYLMYSNGERKESRHRWQIVDSVGLMSDKKLFQEKHYVEQFSNEISYCRSLNAKFLIPSEEIHESNFLTVNTEMPTLRGRLSTVVSSVKPLSQFNSLYFILYDAYDSEIIVSCAPLNLVKSKSANVIFKQAPLIGHVTFYQETPLDPTLVKFNLNVTSPTVYYYGIDTLPSIKRRKSETKKCPNVKESIFNPNRLDTENIPFEGQGTTDQYAVGDLSGKFCSIAIQITNSQINKPLYFSTWDYNLPLFGRNSIIGRALVFFDFEGNPVGCSNIELDSGAITTAYATFDQPIQGQFIFRQSANHCEDEVFVYVEISKPDTLNAIKTDNHAWHIHEYSVKAGFETLSTTHCTVAGGHHNPYNVSVDATYLRDCTSLTNERCERGDTSSKLSSISITPYKPNIYGENGNEKIYGEPEVAKYYFIDNQLSLCGPNSIIGKSIVVHEKHFTMPRIGCANILEFKTKI